MREAIERKAAEIRLALLAELARTAPLQGGIVMPDMNPAREHTLNDIERRVRILNQLDPNGGGFGVLSSVSGGAGSES